MEDPSKLPPETILGAQRWGLISGLVLVAWALGFRLLDPDLSPVAYWTTYVSVGVLIVAVPSLIFGRRAGREHLARRNPQERPAGRQ